jgi:hypothetical protein
MADFRGVVLKPLFLYYFWVYIIYLLLSQLRYAIPNTNATDMNLELGVMLLRIQGPCFYLVHHHFMVASE